MGHDTGVEPSAVVAHAHVAPPAVRVAAPAVAVVGHGHGHSVAVAGHAVAGHAVAGHAVVHRGCLGPCVNVWSSILCRLVSQT